MNTKNSIINIILSVAIFAAGCILVKLNIGRLGMVGFTGYILCSVAVTVVLCTLTTKMVMRSEVGKIERKDN